MVSNYQQRPGSFPGFPLANVACAPHGAFAVPYTKHMYLVAIAWLYVAVMMAVAEATHPAGTVLGAVFTFLLYGLLPVGLVMYVMGTPLRRKARLAREARDAAPGARAGEAPETSDAPGVQPDTGRHAAGAAQTGGVAAVRKED